jgi:hypothetical protein
MVKALTTLPAPVSNATTASSRAIIRTTRSILSILWWGGVGWGGVGVATVETQRRHGENLELAQGVVLVTLLLNARPCRELEGFSDLPPNAAGPQPNRNDPSSQPWRHPQLSHSHS